MNTFGILISIYCFIEFGHERLVERIACNENNKKVNKKFLKMVMLSLYLWD